MPATPQVVGGDPQGLAPGRPRMFWKKVGRRAMYDHLPSRQRLRQATNMLGKFEEAKLLAGGQTLLPTMKLRLASPSHIIDLTDRRPPTSR
jgi:hypothetical protein